MEIIKALKNLRKKWVREYNKEQKFQQQLAEKYKNGYVPGCYEKSVGVTIGYGHSISDIDKLIKKLEQSMVRVPGEHGEDTFGW
jgi:hypothetical protein